MSTLGARTRGISLRVGSWGVLTALLGVPLVALLGCGEEAPPPELPPRAIQWERVSGALASQRRVISGIVTAIDETRLAFEVSGTVATVDVDLGDSVEKDQELARLDPEPLELAVADAEAGLAEAKALREHSRATLARYVEAASAVAKLEIDRARAQRDSRESQYQAARARLNLANRDLRLSVLIAPFRGSVSSRSIDPAQRIAAGETAFELDSEEGGLRVEVQMPETLIDRVKQGSEVRVRFPSMNDPRFEIDEAGYPAIVADIGTRAGDGNAFPVRADLSAKPPGVRPGMTAEVTFSLARGADDLDASAGFMIPIAAALPEADGVFAVFVYDEGTSTVKRRPIQLGGVGDNTVAALGGLEEGDIIATAGVSFLRDGQPVTLLGKELVGVAP
jgi:multidrug efflux system membrane fusion protein